ncbi:ABC transporter permease [Propionivibrio dicarboxylicus]|uniref:Peptide/nickel transport system permease protein n=1 Tax=Propionivibrio dicarboxylicus TaxID=83767 RepID=A0A1G7WW24_9RHOO|nr:ABC transporter permease [Propionivibrio dicarboxylicus]SDG76104.1 peptide/nickel transport system permease protein [Propionivibrio dicarboxylicus]
MDSPMIAALEARLERQRRQPRILVFARRHPVLVAGAALLATMVLLALLAPWLAPHDPTEMNVLQRLKPPSADYLLGTDALGRDILSRTLYGARVSLLVGVSVALFSALVGLGIGTVAGFNRVADRIIMRIMDGMMAIPGILLAVALMTLIRASIATVVIAIAMPEIPRVVRLVRSLVLTIREQPYIEAARAMGTRLPMILLRHVIPNLLTPLIVQASFIWASAMIFEAYLSFLGAGTPPEVPSWGNMMAEGRSVVQLAFGIILYPGIFLGLTVLAVNLVGDGLRDLLDPRIGRKL